MLESTTTSHQESKSDLIDIAGLWENKTKNGEKYLSGNLGGARVLIFANKYKNDNDRAPDYKLYFTKRQFQEDRMGDAASAVAPSKPASAAPAAAAAPKQEDDIPF